MTHPLQGTLENRDGAWVLTLVRDFGQPAEKLWPWLTDPDRLRLWSPIVPDQALDSVGPREVRENPRPATWSASIRRMSWCTDGATTSCARDLHQPRRAAG